MTAEQQITKCALEAGIMISSAHGQGKGKLMPVSDIDTLVKFTHEIIRNLPKGELK